MAFGPIEVLLLSRRKHLKKETKNAEEQKAIWVYPNPPCLNPSTQTLPNQEPLKVTYAASSSSCPSLFQCTQLLQHHLTQDQKAQA